MEQKNQHNLVCPLCGFRLYCHHTSIFAQKHREFHDDFEFEFIDADES